MTYKKLIEDTEKEIEEAKSVKYRNCLVCEKSYPIRQSDTKRYCSRDCSDIAMRVRDWENKRGMNLRVLKAKLSALKQARQITLKEELKFLEKVTIKIGKRETAIKNWFVVEQRIKKIKEELR